MDDGVGITDTALFQRIEVDLDLLVAVQFDIRLGNKLSCHLHLKGFYQLAVNVGKVRLLSIGLHYSGTKQQK